MGALKGPILAARQRGDRESGLAGERSALACDRAARGDDAATQQEALFGQGSPPHKLICMS